MLALLLAAAAGPMLPPLDRALTFTDYPAAALQDDLSAAALAEIAIAPDGRVTACKAVQRFGDARLANGICAIVARKTLRGATFRDGTPAPAYVTELVRLTLPGTRTGDAVAAIDQQPDATLAVSRLPDGAASADLRLVIAVDPQGAVTDCAADPARETAAPALVAAVCANHAQWRRPAHPAGAPVAYVSSLKVRVTAAAQP